MGRISRRTGLTALLCLGLMGPAFGQGRENAGRAALLHFVKTTRSAAGSFSQVQRDRQGALVDAESRGTFAFERPGRFAWRTSSPYVQEIVATDRVVRLWDRDLNQVTVRSLEAGAAATPAALLFGDEKALDAFRIEEAGVNEAGAAAAVRATAKNEDNAFAEAVVAFDAEGTPVFMRLTDHFGLATELRFSQVRLNPVLTPKDFELDAPADADILEDRTNVF